MSDDPILNIPAELLEALLDNPHESNILIDAQGIVRFISSHNEKFYRTSQGESVGRHILELNPESELPRVLRTGRAEIGRLFRLHGKERFVARIPLRDRAGNIVGAVGKLLFWHPEKVKQMARQLEVLESRLNYYEKELHEVYRSRYSLERIVGESEPLRAAKRMAAQAAAADLDVLITGETGTGKEVFAHAIHLQSNRRERPLVRVNCASIPHELFESELFGYEAGAFTGAQKKGKPGKFELADKGTIFLDEVGDLPLPLQAKLLRVIQEREVERLGATRTLKLDFRVIAATNRDLTQMMQEGLFRRDLFYRLNIFQLNTPALRDIREDVPRLAYHLLAQVRLAQPRAPRRITPEAMQSLLNYAWPGNVRELRNVLERAATVATEDVIGREHLPREVAEVGRPQAGGESPQSLRQEMARAERRAIERALRFTGGNRSHAARVLGIHRSGLHQKMRAYGIAGEA
ncbi:MAG: sigma 54-interacting transcriptional regulator [Pseudomonadota bacterium]